MIIVVLRLEAQSSNIIFVPIDIVAVLGVFILPPYLAMLMMSLFYFTTQFFTNPRFQWSTEIMNRLMYGLCTGAVGGIVTAAYHLWGIQTASWQLFILMMIGIMTFYATNISIAGLWQKYIKNIPFEQFLKQVHAGFPLHNFVAAPVAYVIVISYQAKLLGGWGGWTMMAISFPIFYAHYISTKQTYALQSAHQKIRDNEQILRSLTEGLPIGVYRVQPDGKFISANRTMAHMLGYSNVDELLSHNTLDFYVDPSQRERLREKRLKNKDVTAAIIHIKRRDGSLIWVRDTVRITYTPEGDVAYVDGALEDITEQRRIELALEETNRLIRKAKQEWETTVDSLPHFVCLLDESMRVIRSNRILKIWGVDVTGKIEGQLIYDVLGMYAGEESLKDLFMGNYNLLRQNRSFRFDVQHAETGQIVVIQLRPLLHPQFGDAISRDSFAVMIMQDITSEKLLERQLRDINAELEARVAERTIQLEHALAQEREVSEFRARFSSMISHEFRTPLTIIQTSVDLIERYRDKLSTERVRELPARIRQQVKHLVSLLEDIMTISQAETVGIRRADMQLDLSQFCAIIKRDMEHMLPIGRSLNFESPQKNYLVEMDEKLIRQMITNLISNAIKYSLQERPIHLSFQIDVKNLIITVRDEGIGIPQESQPYLFEAFYRAENVGAISGTGLGLAIVKLVVELHEGHVDLQSTHEQGTTFIITLPVIVKEKAHP